MENNLLGAKLQLNNVNVNRFVDDYSSSLGIGIKTRIELVEESNRVRIHIRIYVSEASKLPEIISQDSGKVEKEIEESIIERSEAIIELDYELVLAEGRKYTSDMDGEIWKFIYLQVNMQTTLMCSLINLPSFDLPLELNSEM